MLSEKKRLSLLEERRVKIAEVISYWGECRKGRVSSYDQEAIHKFIETYDPEWIKNAIKIATKEVRPNYVKYVAAILRNWAKGGRLTHHPNSELTLETKRATEKQIKYIKDLLNHINMDLKDFYHKTDYDELTMLDAKQLIESLTKS